MTDIRATRPEHFNLRFEANVAIVALSRPERKNPLTFESYAALRDWFRALHYADDFEAVVFASTAEIFRPVATCMKLSARS